MMKIKGTPVGFIVKVLVSLCILFVGFELFFRFVLPANEYPRIAQDEITKLSCFDNSWMSEGVGSSGHLCKPLCHWRINNAGWNSVFDYSQRIDYTRPRIAIIGNSYIEGWAADVESHIDVHLNQLFNENVDVYSFGMSGVSFAQYLAILPNIESEYDPDIYLILLSSFGISRSLDPSISPYRFYIEESNSGYILVDPPEVYVQNRYGRILFRSAFARYLRLNKQVFANRMNIEVEEIAGTVEEHQIMPNEYLEAGKFFVDSFCELLPNDRIIFFSSGKYLDYMILDEIIHNDLLFQLVCIEDYMNADYDKHGIEFHGENDPHWNNYGNEVVARGIYPYVREAITELGY